jgi:hypothetical protein
VHVPQLFDVVLLYLLGQKSQVFPSHWFRQLHVQLGYVPSTVVAWALHSNTVEHTLLQLG